MSASTSGRYAFAQRCQQHGTVARRVPFIAHRAAARRIVPCRSAQTVEQTQTSTTSAGKLPNLWPLGDDYASVHKFAAFGNWIVPGHVMLGRYPFVEPSRCTTRAIGEAQLEQILGAGITTFVSLQAEIPAQEEMTVAGANGFLPYKSTADLIRCTLNGPPPSEIVDGLRNPGLDKFLPPRRKPARWQEAQVYNPVELRYLHCPITDLGVPTSEQLQQLVAELEARVAGGEKLYIHCWGGRGRAGTVGSCLLAKMYNLTAEEALQRIQLAFDTRLDGGRPSPETEEQVAFVREFIAGLAQ